MSRVRVRTEVHGGTVGTGQSTEPGPKPVLLLIGGRAQISDELRDCAFDVFSGLG